MARGRSPGHRCLAVVRGRGRAPGRDARNPARRGRRADRAQRRRQDDARERHERASTSRRPGSVELEGRDITSWRPHRRGRAGLARTFQHSHSFGNLSVRENVEVSALGVGAAPREARRRAGSSSISSAISQRADAPASALPHGDERKLEVARALAIEPRFVLLDEPAAGLPEAEIPDFAARARDGSRRAWCGRAPDRPQHGARHGRSAIGSMCLTKDGRLRRGHPRLCAETWTSPLRIWARALCART